MIYVPQSVAHGRLMKVYVHKRERSLEAIIFEGEKKLPRVSVCLRACVCVCVCVCDRERVRESAR